MNTLPPPLPVAAPVEEHTSSATLALIFGCIAVLLGWCFVGVPAGVAAIWFARKEASHSWAKWGVILAIVGFAEFGLLLAIAIATVVMGG
jgi:hypothetical protein